MCVRVCRSNYMRVLCMYSGSRRKILKGHYVSKIRTAFYMENRTILK